MPLRNHTPEEIVAEIDDLLASDHFGEDYVRGKGRIDPVGMTRYRMLERIKEYLETKGLPEIPEQKAGLSLVPSCLQEASDDDLPWMTQDINLWQLQPFFDIDYMVQNEGMDRVDATPEQFGRYVRQSLEAIEKIR